jgi:hypothetical protein
VEASDERGGELLSNADFEDRVPAVHPLRLIRRIVNEVLIALAYRIDLSLPCAASVEFVRDRNEQG